jgi:hypothetical protein
VYPTWLQGRVLSEPIYIAVKNSDFFTFYPRKAGLADFFKKEKDTIKKGHGLFNRIQYVKKICSGEIIENDLMHQGASPRR